MRKGRFWDSELKEWVADKLGEEMTPDKSKATVFTYDDWLKWGQYGDFVFDELAEDERMRLEGQTELPGLNVLILDDPDEIVEIDKDKLLSAWYKDK